VDSVDLFADILEAYDSRMLDTECIRNVLNGRCGIRIEEMARAIAMLTTYTEREALDSLKLELRKFTNSGGALNKMFDAKTLGKVNILAGDLAKLRIARDIIADVMPDLWTESLAYIRKLDKIDVLEPLDKLVAEAEYCLRRKGE